MNIHQIEYFVSAAENLNFTKAARIHFVSQTAITQQIKSLENQLNTNLFERSGPHIKLTTAGEIYLEEAKTILQQINNAKRKIELVSNGYSGNIKIGFLKGCEQLGFSTLISEFKQTYPGISFQFQRFDYSQLFSTLHNKSNDIILNMKPSDFSDDDIQCLDYKISSLYVVLSIDHPLAYKTSLIRTELKDETFIIINTSEALITHIFNEFMAFHFLPKKTIYVNDVESLLLTISSHSGIAIIPEYDLHLLAGFPTLRTIPLGSKEDIITSSFFWNKENANPAIKHFCDFVAQKI